MEGLIKSVTQHRYVLFNFIARDLKVKYRGSVAGYLWTLIEPMALVATYYFVFHVIAQRGDEKYPLIVLLGVLPYNLFSTIVTGGANSLVVNAPLIRKIYLPRELFLIALIGSNLIVFLLSMLVVVPFLAFYKITPGWTIVFLPIGLLLLLLFSMGVGLAASCLNVVYRDVAYVLTVVLRLLFYGSPVIYSLEMVPVRFRDLYLCNPMAVYLSLIRDTLLHQSLDVPWPQIMAAAAIAVLTFIAGALLFRRWEFRVVKYL